MAAATNGGKLLADLGTGTGDDGSPCWIHPRSLQQSCKYIYGHESCWKYVVGHGGAYCEYGDDAMYGIHIDYNTTFDARCVCCEGRKDFHPTSNRSYKCVDARATETTERQEEILVLAAVLLSIALISFAVIAMFVSWKCLKNRAHVHATRVLQADVSIRPPIVAEEVVDVSDECASNQQAPQSHEEMLGSRQELLGLYDATSSMSDSDSARLFESLVGISSMGTEEHWLIKPQDIHVLTDTFSQDFRGGFGQVCKGMLLESTEVALKLALCELPSANSVESAAVALKNEIRLLRRLRHPNIVLFHGLSWLASGGDEMAGSLVLVLAWARGGTLSEYVRRLLTEQLDTKTISKKLCCDVARAMVYLHSQDPPILHRDLKPRNILLDSAIPPTAQISDFGLSVLISGSVKGRAGTDAYMAPEVRQDRPYGTPADVFSFGCVCYFAVTGRAQSSQIDSSGRKPQSAGSSMKSWLSAEPVGASLHEDPKLRPTFLDLYKCLKETERKAGVEPLAL